jgi:deoxyribodipyrimidine photo-lyase
MSLPKVSICWFRRDLRLHDHAALHHALQQGFPVVPLFVFDREILDQLEDKKDRRVEFIHAAITNLQQRLSILGSSMEIHYSTPLEVMKQLTARYEVQHVFFNHDYEPYALKRDEAVAQFLHSKGIACHSYKDQVLFEKDEVVKDDGKPYTVFTPYSRKWKAKFQDAVPQAYPVEPFLDQLYKQSSLPVPSLEAMGFQPAGLSFPPSEASNEILKHYKERRDLPAVQGTSRLGVHLRFGTISIRELAQQAAGLSESFLNELIWRDFYHMILWHFPQVGEGKAFKKEYDLIQWRNNETEFGRWCSGTTGYPIVDAGMRELNATGFMHNRVRMIVASFLTKHLLIDWRWGEAYFAEKLLDFDLAANNGGWQWAAGSGCDAAPYFRIFNPYLQTKKFDPELKYIRRWVPEFEQFSYPKPIVEHELARKRCLEVYAGALKK